MRHARPLLACLSLAAAACGSRSDLDALTGLDLDAAPGVELPGADGAVEADAGADAAVDAAVDAQIDAVADVSVDAPADAKVDAPRDSAVDAPVDAKKDAVDFFDAFPIPDSGPIATCAQCAQQHCGTQVNTCYNDPNCVAGLTCALSSCLNGGAPSIQCILGCFNGHLSAAGEAVQAFQCISGSCGTDCRAALGGAGGGLPGAGGAGLPGGYPIDVPATFVWPAELQSLSSAPLSLPPPEAFDAYAGMVPSCGVVGRPLCAAR